MPQQRGEQERRRHRLAVAHALVGVGEREVDEARPERLFEDDVEQRQHAVMQPVLAQALQRFDRVSRQQQLFHLVEQPRRRHVVDQRRQRGIGVAVFFSISMPELRREPRGAQHAHRVFAIAGDRIADQAQPPRLDVGDAADVVPDFLGRRVEVERVDREVAAQRVLGLRAEHVVGQQPAVLVGGVVADLTRAERRDLDRLGAGQHVHQPKAPADDERAAKQRLHLLRRGVGRDVEVLGRRRRASGRAPRRRR